MIVRSWLIVGTLIVAGAWVLTVPLSPPPYQASPGSSADAYRAEGLLPAIGGFKASKEIGHDVFEVPETDAEHLAAAGTAGGAGMPGMTMPAPGETAPSAPSASSPPAMEMNQHMPAQPPSSTMPGTAAGEHEAMPGMTMSAPGKGEQPAPAPPAMEMGQERPAQATPSAVPGMAMGAEEGEEGHMGEFGIAVVPHAMASMAARTVTVEMGEWGFKPATIEVTPGEVIRFVVRNAGKLPHEFMFMPATAMQALDYRLARADWNLTEHEAIFEQEVILPGDSFEVTLKIIKPGSWMYMCMFPYHMQFGMMGMMMSEGATTPGMDMGGMKM